MPFPCKDVTRLHVFVKARKKEVTVACFAHSLSFTKYDNADEEYKSH